MSTRITLPSFCTRLFSTGTLACLLLSGAAAVAQTPVNLLYFPFTDGPGSNTTPSSVSLGGLGINLTGYNATGVLEDFHGAVGSGVNGIATGARALCLTNGDGGTQPGNATGGSTGANAANSTADRGDAALAGTITNFVVSMWFNQPVKAPSGAGFVLPRLFVLSTGGSPGENDGSANSIGVKFQQENEFIFSINATTTLTTTYGAGTYPSGDFTTNKWYFVAWVYDGTNLTQYTGSDSSPATLVPSTAAGSTSGLVVNLGNPSTLVVGDRSYEGARGFDGWMQDFRFYKGAPSLANAQAYVENIRQAIAPKIPTITGIYPNGTTLLEGTNTLVFTGSSASGFNLTNFSLSVNGVNVSSSLSYATNGTPGTSTNVTAKYVGLPQQTIVTAVMTATDGLGLVGTSSVTFDTYSPTNFIIKAEEFDYNGGSFIANPDYTDGNPADANSYYQLDSVEGIDTHKGPSVGDNTATDYRYSDGAGTRTQTPVATSELPLPQFANLLDGSGNPIVKHEIADWSSGEWQNYTKIFPAGNYNVYARLSTASGSTVVFDQVTGGQGSTSQSLNNLGTFTLSGTGSFQWVPLMKLGSLAVVNLAGQHTVRATTGGGANADLYMLVPANPNLPVLSNVHPDGSMLFQNTNTLSFTVSSPSTTISTANIHVSLNGVDVSASLIFTGGPSTWNVKYNGLVPNQTYITSINVTDNNGGTANGALTIDTWVPIVQFEAEDFDFDPTKSPIFDVTGYRFINNSVPTTAGVPATNSYEGQTGDELIDQFGAGAGTRSYRPGDVATTVVTDTPRAQFIQANASDFNIGFLGAGFWEDYTRTWPAGTYNIYGRMASGASQSGLPTPPGIRDDVDLVEVGYGTTNQVLDYLGTFNIPTTNGYSAYTYVPLIDKFGNYANVTLSGNETLRSTLDLTTTAGVAQFGLNVNFYMLTAPRTDLPRIDAVAPDAPLQQGNVFSFVASSPAYGIPTSGVVVTLNGVNISSNLLFSGSPSSWTVSYPGLQPNTSYTAVITITDNDNQTHSTTVSFDTFSPNNFTWEAEDFDFGPENSPVPNGSGLRFIDNPSLTSVPATNSYYDQTGDGFGYGNGIDESSLFFNLAGIAGVTYTYRPNDWVSTEVTTDQLRQKYLEAQVSQDNALITDYDVKFLTNGGWINYTRTFPTGSFYVYGRLSAGNGPFALQLAQVTNGVGTETQVSNILGSFGGTGTSFATWQYVPLTNTSGAPAVVSFSGVETLQISGDYNEDANYFMLVGPNQPKLVATQSGSNVLLSYQSQAGFHYTIYYKNHLTDATWTALNSPVLGDGTIQSVSDGLTHATRFYVVGVQ